MSEATKGVIVEFDFAVLNGAELLYDTTRRFLKELDGIAFDLPTEATYLAGGNYQGGLAGYFAAVKTKKTAAKAARDLAEAFNRAVSANVSAAVTPAFRNFVKTVSDAGVKVVIATRADAESAQAAFASLLGENVVLYPETSVCYGTVKWDAWRRASALNRIRNVSALAVTGSGLGVRSALLAGMGSLAVMNDHVAYQDFGGADGVVNRLDAAAARKALELLRA